MINIKIADVTLREAEESGTASMSFKEKLEAAKLLEKMQVDIIETGPVGGSPAEAAFIRTLASTLSASVVSVPVSLERACVDRAWAALSKAKKPRLNIIAPTSTVQMEYEQHMKAEAVLSLVSEITEYCVSICPDVEFTAADATRSETGFLASVLKAALAAGAATVTLCDSAGQMLPDELGAFIASVRASVPGIQAAGLSLHCRDNLGLATAVALSGARNGAGQIKVTSGAGGGTLSMEQFINVIKLRGETLGISYNINDTAIRRSCSRLAALTGSGAAAQAPGGTGGDGSGEPDLPDIPDINTLRKHIESLGYDVTGDDLERIYIQYKEVAKNKKIVRRDLEALVAETAGQAAPVYTLRNYVINSGSTMKATAFVELEKDGAASEALSSGDGPIDAAFKAAEQITGAHYDLEEFQINAVTGGREATGDALVKLRSAGKLYSGRGVSTDIVGASIRAYLAAVNKIIHEERQP